MPYPENKKDLQQFLGMVAYVSKFMTYLSHESRVLCELTKDQEILYATVNHAAIYDKIKKLTLF